MLLLFKCYLCVIIISIPTSLENEENQEMEKKSKFLEKKFLYPIIKVNKRKQTDCHIHGAERS